MDRGAHGAKVEQRPVVRRLLHDDVVTRADEVAEDERVRLQRTVGDQHLLLVHAVALRDPLAQWRVAGRRAVTGDRHRIQVERAVRGGLEAIDVNDVQRRGAPGERNQLSGGHANSVRVPSWDFWDASTIGVPISYRCSLQLWT
jgi:hypothetical protein